MSSHDNAASLDWADDVDDEIDFGAPVFSDDEDLPASLTTGIVAAPESSPSPIKEPAPAVTSSSSSSTPRYTAGFADGSNRSLDRKSHNGSSVQPSSTRRRDEPSSRPTRDYSHPEQSRSFTSSRQGPNGRSTDYHGQSSYGSPSNNNNNSSYSSLRDHPSQRPGTPRQVIPLPPKPSAALDANSLANRAKDRSRSPSYRSRSPLPDNDRPWDHGGRQQHGRSLSPSSAMHQHQQPIYTAGYNARSLSPGRHQPRTHMDQVINAMNRNDSRERQPNHRSREISNSEGRWEKTLQEDKPYPPLQTSHYNNNNNNNHGINRNDHPGSLPKDDIVYFKRRDGRARDPSPEKPLTTGRMYHERLETSGNRSSSSQRTAQPDMDRWQKVRQEPDLPYPERSHPPVGGRPNNNTKPSHAQTRSQGQNEMVALAPERSVSMVSPRQERGSRGKGKDQKRRSKDILEPAEDDQQGGGVPWWEQSTYSVKKPEPVKVEPKAEPKPEPKKEAKKEAKKDTKDTKAPVQADVPWWEQSTYKLQPKTIASTSTAEVTNQLSKVDLNSSSTPGNDVMERRKALGQKTAVSGVEALTLVSRGGEDSGSSRSIKDREVQEQVFAEIKDMIAAYEKKNGTNKLLPIPSRSRQADEIEKVVESFRKLREGIFATETKDRFACQVYEQSVLISLYAGNIPELTKALHHLVHVLHPAVYPFSGPAIADTPDTLGTLSPERQRFLSLHILYTIAKPNLPSTSSSIENLSLISTSISCARTETDSLIGSLVQVYDHYCLSRRRTQTHSEAPSVVTLRLSPDLLFALAYWKALRDNNWILRERLLSKDEDLQLYPVAWEQRLAVQRSLGDHLGSARSQTVSCISKAFYSLPIVAMAQAVGLAGEKEDVPEHARSERDSVLIKRLQGSYGLRPIVVRDGQLLFKAKN
ncbi:hypothetical protein BGZ93_004750 [Podila epicladia]|nr:hypothetical protein BGZ92_005200 [Podila epicladia]KAG0096284.1 hypothetical protein BGZ93_004750 [Podila epicladia]